MTFEPKYFCYVYLCIKIRKARGNIFELGPFFLLMSLKLCIHKTHRISKYATKCEEALRKDFVTVTITPCRLSGAPRHFIYVLYFTGAQSNIAIDKKMSTVKISFSALPKFQLTGSKRRT